MNKGNQQKTLTKYLNYLLELIETHNLNRLDAVNLKDTTLLKKYFPSNASNLNQAYSYMIKQLLKLNIISQIDSGVYIPKQYARKYIINLLELEKHCKQCGILTDTIYQFNENKFSNKACDINNPLYTPPQYIDNKVEIEKMSELINNCNPYDFKKLVIKKDSEFTNEEKEYLRSQYKEKIKSENKIYGECVRIINWINEKADIHFSMEINIQESDNYYFSLKPSCRQYNPMCSIEDRRNYHRSTWIKKYGFDKEFDLHSAIFAVARLLNLGEFDVDWDVKKEVFSNWADIKEYQPELKIILNRCFFSVSKEQAYTQYTFSCNKSGNRQIIDKETFKLAYDEVQSLIGGSLPYINTIFLYESLFELLIVKEFIKEGYDVRNVYDCFYYKSSQISEEEVKDMVQTIADNFNNYITKI